PALSTLSLHDALPILQEPVAHVLLVVGRLLSPGLPLRRRPEPRRVRSQHLVAERQRTRSVVTELHLGVRENDAGLLGEFCATLVDRKSTRLNSSHRTT